MGQEEQEKIKRVGRFRLHKGHKVWKCNLIKKELSIVTLDPEKGANILVDRESIYFSALNLKNARRKIRDKFKIEVEFKVN